MEATLTLYNIAGSSTLDVKLGLVEDLREAAIGVGGVGEVFCVAERTRLRARNISLGWKYRGTHTSGPCKQYILSVSKSKGKSLQASSIHNHQLPHLQLETKHKPHT
jgi:hypothetical protein